MTLSNAYNAYCAAEGRGQIDMADWCAIHFVSDKAIKEAQALELQLVQCCKDLGMRYSQAKFLENEDYNTVIRKAIAFGFHHQSALNVDENNENYQSVHGECRALLNAASAIDRKNAQWIVYDKLVSSGGAWYYTTATVFELEWLMVCIWTLLVGPSFT